MPNKDCLELMTQRQMMLTRLRQIQLEQYGTLTKNRAAKLEVEENALISLLNEDANLEGQHLNDLKRAIKTNVSPAELDSESNIQEEANHQ